MGVPTLWRRIQEAAQQECLAQIAFDAFKDNKNGLRGFRLGVDLSAWLCHVQARHGGPNPQLMTLFYRLCRLLSLGFLPLFVLDGPHRPHMKRGKWIDGGEQEFEREFCILAEAFGFEWRRAPGEAEAELAYLNAKGLVDGIMTDDVDALLNGAAYILRNWGNKLSGHGGGAAIKAKAKLAPQNRRAFSSAPFSDGEDDGPSLSPADVDSLKDDWVYTFKMKRIHNRLKLDRAALLLNAILSGGDYNDGIARCGTATATAVAKCGFGDCLFNAVAVANLQGSDLETFLSRWRSQVCNELRTNSEGHLSRREKKLADSLELDPTFPDVAMLRQYTNPVTSETIPCLAVHGDFTWSHPPDVGRLAELCYEWFEYPREEVVQRFRNRLWHGLLMDHLRRRALSYDQTPSLQPRLLGIVGPKIERTHLRTNYTLECRVSFDPEVWVRLALGALPDGLDLNVEKSRIHREAVREVRALERIAQGLRRIAPEKQRSSLTFDDPMAPLREWIPKRHLEIAAPEFLEKCAEEQREKEETKRSPKKMTLKKAGATDTVAESCSRKVKGKCKATIKEARKEAKAKSSLIPRARRSSEHEEHVTFHDTERRLLSSQRSSSESISRARPTAAVSCPKSSIWIDSSELDPDVDTQTAPSISNAKRRGHLRGIGGFSGANELGFKAAKPGAAKGAVSNTAGNRAGRSGSRSTAATGIEVKVNAKATGNVEVIRLCSD